MLFPLHRTSSCRVPFPRRVRDGDPHGRRLRHGGSVALGGSAALVQYSPARRTYFVRDDRVAGTRPVPEILYYEDCGGAGCTPQYNGNVSRMAHSLAHGNAGYGESRDVTYAYDLMNRLTDVDDAISDDFDEVFAYDPQGRIVSQRRGTNVAATSGGEYAYYAQSDRLEKVTAGMSAAVDAERLMNADSNFVYDADGNMTYDASKKMTVSYDYRGLPTEFRKAEADGDSTRLVMAYDGSGSRIMKRRDRKTAGGTEWITELTTHYTGIGSEIRVSGLDGTAKVVVNLPQGLGRYGVENASESVASSAPGFEWYLKNHLGSTMLVYGTGSGSGSVRAAYDYRAFGEQVNLTVPADKVTETFTGKELDDETDLGYWGARYLDQMLGLWVSADPKREYASPYIYVGNNPIVSVDKKGNQSANANEFNTSLGWSYLMDQVIAPLFSASVDMGKKAVVASSAAAVGALGAGALALAAPGVVSGASALLTKGTAFVAENGPGLLASINNPANYGKAFLLGAVGKVMTENPPNENNYHDSGNGISP